MLQNNNLYTVYVLNNLNYWVGVGPKGGAPWLTRPHKQEYYNYHNKIYNLSNNDNFQILHKKINKNKI